jgi:uric acid-xanthine permease
VGTSFATIPVATGAFAQWYANGTCPVDSTGARLPCPDGYGAILGTACVCALLEIGLSFMPPKALKKAFPPLVTGPVVLLIGVSLIGTGSFLIHCKLISSFEDWGGGSGNCYGRPTTGDFMLCPSNTGKHALAWGSAQFIGLGFSVWVTIIIIERFGSPIMKSCAVVLGLVVGIIISVGAGYFDDSPITAAPAATFIWVHTFKLSVSGPIVLPFLAVFLILMMEAIGDITATCDVSR